MLYPYKFQPILMERVWGGQALARFGKPIPAGQRIGESWEISDRDEAQSIVSNGPDRGKTLRELVGLLGVQLLGSNVVAPPPAAGKPFRFPLLIKLLDARERLSLQVHPPASVAPQLGGEPKTEMWYILDADPDAHLIAGLRPGVTRDGFLQALQANALEQCVHRFRVVPGDVLFVPSGRIHAIDAGVVLAEIQQNSDTTYRVYDWGRLGLDGKPRQLHVQEALACVDFQDVDPQKTNPRVECHDVNGLWRLVECPHFWVHKLELSNAWPGRCDGSSFHIIGGLAGTVGILTADNQEESLQPGEFALLPAALGFYTLTPLGGPASALKITVPSPIL